MLDLEKGNKECGGWKMNEDKPTSSRVKRAVGRGKDEESGCGV